MGDYLGVITVGNDRYEFDMNGLNIEISKLIRNGEEKKRVNRDISKMKFPFFDKELADIVILDIIREKMEDKFKEYAEKRFEKLNEYVSNLNKFIGSTNPNLTLDGTLEERQQRFIDFCQGEADKIDKKVMDQMEKDLQNNKIDTQSELNSKMGTSVSDSGKEVNINEERLMALIKDKKIAMDKFNKYRVEGKGMSIKAAVIKALYETNMIYKAIFDKGYAEDSKFTYDDALLVFMLNHEKGINKDELIAANNEGKKEKEKIDIATIDEKTDEQKIEGVLAGKETEDVKPTEPVEAETDEEYSDTMTDFVLPDIAAAATVAAVTAEGVAEELPNINTKIVNFPTTEGTKEEIKDELANIATDIVGFEMASQPTNEMADEITKDVKTKVLEFKKPKTKNAPIEKAGYVDTLVLCMLAELTIFGVLLSLIMIMK